MSDDFKLYEAAGFGYVRCKTCLIIVSDGVMARKGHEKSNGHKVATYTHGLQEQMKGEKNVE